MSALRPLPFRRVERALNALGFVAVSQRGSHVKFQHEDGRWTTVPRHPELGRGILAEILREANIDREQFLKLA
ncbi:MAG: type II toxin-antitoxin system HicA family toxin [Euryarchaeota archaeon]|nr:type II toxin-antitoxin system HicA family toxin [Euryarchaeota archaeon]